MKMQLSELKPGDKGTILSHHAEGAVRQRLLDLGLMPEVEIELVRFAPMGDPLEIRVGLTNVVIRATEAETVIVNRLS
ncbi:ferrous iron transport protein A [Vibrio sp. JC009]|uniref:FeoA family protein n=1 Tax=Vibrio sp. JC009 TaxID=2912314 RepID=UPI0023AFFF00|nr:FeoA family protein [Vibrio sp. JC009]WED24684.1 ferrous iron transport protein A [Vibrio sp. JC009]